MSRERASSGKVVGSRADASPTEPAFEEDPGESVCLLTSEEHYAKLREDSIAMWPLL